MAENEQGSTNRKLTRRRLVAAAGGVSALALAGRVLLAALGGLSPNRAAAQSSDDTRTDFTLDLDFDPTSPTLAVFTFDDNATLTFSGTKDGGGAITAITSVAAAGPPSAPSKQATFTLDANGRPTVISSQADGTLELLCTTTLPAS